jgi:hypothetical protein
MSMDKSYPTCNADTGGMLCTGASLLVFKAFDQPSTHLTVQLNPILMYKIKNFVMPVQVLAWLLIAGTMTVIWHTFLAGAISMLTSSLTFTDVSNSAPMWFMNLFMFMGFLVSVGTWLWED